MKISRIILKGVNNFENFDYSFEDEWTQSVPDSLLLLGPNGSGKTTILRAIASLWEILGTFLDKSPNQNSDFIDPVLWQCNLAAIEIENLLSAPLWVCFGLTSEVSNLLANQKNCYGFGASRDTLKNIKKYPGYIPDSISWSSTDPNGNNGEVDIQSQHWFENLPERFLQNRLGAKSDLPNVVTFESENRTLMAVEEDFSVTPEQKIFNWLARYTSTDRRKGSIQNYLFTLKAIDPTSYESICADVNTFLSGKKIAGFHPNSGELMITTESEQWHPVHLLSSGEKQILLMIAYITREFRPGGIILIDEPDLHLHVSLRNAFVSHVRQIVANQNGQLIIASHDPEIWNRFSYAQQINLGPLVKVRS